MFSSCIEVFPIEQMKEMSLGHLTGVQHEFVMDERMLHRVDVDNRDVELGHGSLKHSSKICLKKQNGGFNEVVWKTSQA